MPAKDEDVTMMEPHGVSSPKELRNALYARCASFEEGHVFDQDELFEFGIIPENSIHDLLVYTKQLANEGLFKVMTKDGKACWKVVKRADALKYRTLSQEEALVYSYIEGAAREGIWSKILRNKTRLHMTTVNHAVKSLENKNLIKAVKVVKHPNRKTYMMANLQPSEDVTGGAFYTDGELDEEFIAQIKNWVDRYIVAKSWYFPPPPELQKSSSSKTSQEEAKELSSLPELQKSSSSKTSQDEAKEPSSLPEHKKTEMTQEQAEEHPPLSEHRKRSSSKMSQEEAKDPSSHPEHKKIKMTQEQTEEHPPLPEHKKKPTTHERAKELRARVLGPPQRTRSKDMLPMHPGYKGYPTVAEITKAINKSGLSTVPLVQSEVDTIVYILCCDLHVEKRKDGKGYTAVKQVHGENGVMLENGLTESPCGRCPVFDLCEPGGPVNARTCEYFTEWIERLKF